MTKDDELAAMVRDFTAVGSCPKSKVKSRIEAYANKLIDKKLKDYQERAVPEYG